MRITLYIAIHNKTGLKYFGKTERFHTQIDLQDKYHGSGTYWRNHLNKYGDDITMKIYGIFNDNKVREVASDFSHINNIVQSDEWANLIDEDGFGNGMPLGGSHTEATKVKIREKRAKQVMRTGWQHTDKAKAKIKTKRAKQIFTQAHRDAMSKAQKGRVYSEEHCKMLSEKAPRTQVIRYDLTGNVIKCYLSLDYVKDDGFQPSNVSKCCSGEYTTSKGSIWRYKEDPLEPEGSILSLF